MHKVHLRLASALLVFFLLPWPGYSQVFSTAFDLHCYQPWIGTPGEVDTIMGWQDQQWLGDHLTHLGPTERNPYNQVSVLGFGPGDTYRLITNDWARKIKQRKALPALDSGRGWYGYFTHLRSRSSFDYLQFSAPMPRLYRIDSVGRIDSSNYITLGYRGSGVGNFVGDPWNEIYFTPMSTDTCDDLVMTVVCSWISSLKRPDSVFILHYGTDLRTARSGDTVWQDEKVFVPGDDVLALQRDGVQGDFRVKGCRDFVSQDLAGNLFIYKNDSVFTLKRFAHAMLYDTLSATWENAPMHRDDFHLFWNALTAVRLSKDPQAPSALCLTGIRRDVGDSSWSANFFAGGPSFGSHRISIRDTTLCIRSPYFYDPTWYGMGFEAVPQNCGDLTGTGNPVILMKGNGSAMYHYFFYVLGDAADESVDMYLGQYHGWGKVDTITADGDRLQDLIIGMPGVNSDAHLATGSILIVHGSREIPSEPKARWRSVAPETGERAKLQVERTSSGLRIFAEGEAPRKITVYNLLGQAVGSTMWANGASSVTLPLALHSGTYVTQAEYGSYTSIVRFQVTQ